MHVIYMDNMHRTWRIPIKEYLHEGSNSIRFYFKSTLRYIEEREALAPADKKITIEASGAIAGNQYIRKGTFHVWMGLGRSVTGCRHLP